MTKTLELLGYAPGDRVLIIHADDVGFSHASNVAVFEGLDGGSLTCGSALVPAPWFAVPVGGLGGVVGEAVDFREGVAAGGRGRSGRIT